MSSMAALIEAAPLANACSALRAAYEAYWVIGFVADIHIDHPLAKVDETDSSFFFSGARSAEPLESALVLAVAAAGAAASEPTASGAAAGAGLVGEAGPAASGPAEDALSASSVIGLDLAKGKRMFRLIFLVASHLTTTVSGFLLAPQPPLQCSTRQRTTKVSAEANNSTPVVFSRRSPVTPTRRREFNERSLVGFIRPETFAVAGGVVAVIFVGYLFVFLTGGISNMRYAPPEEGSLTQVEAPVAVPGAVYEEEYSGQQDDSVPGPIV